MPDRLPAVSLAAVPGRRLKTLAIAEEIERRGFPGIYGPSLGDNLSLCLAIALRTSRIEFGTSITPIYGRHVNEYAAAASFIHEASGGRFRFGIGVSHEPALKRLGLSGGKPLSDTRQFVADLRAVPRAGELPPIVLATLRGTDDPPSRGNRRRHGVRQRRSQPHGGVARQSQRRGAAG